jgi:subtilase family serine protease
VITAFDGSSVTVTNQGAGAAGAFNIAISPGGTTIAAGGLGPGASATYSWTPGGCVLFTATADSSNAVAESNESNNTAEWAPSIC